jgi:DNA polymerase I
MKKLVILDANHLMHRAFWAIQRSLSTSSGELTNAVFGVSSMLITILNREHPDAIIACFDDGKETVRHKEYEEYKAGRSETPDEFYTQIPRVHQCFEVFGVPILSNPEYEADDLIGAVALRGKKEGYDVVIVSGDKDLFQMAGSNIRIAVPHKGYSEPEYLDADGVKENLGVTPEQVPDYKGLVGDSSDNLKGVNGIGPKTGAKLIEKYGSLDGIYENIDEIKGSAKEKLINDKESAFFCRKLARLITDIAVNVDLNEVSDRHASLEDIDRFFTEVEFYTLKTRLKKLLQDNGFAGEYFSGEAVLDIPDEVQERGKGITEEQLPLLD